MQNKKELPHATDIEEVVLGAILIENSAITDANSTLNELYSAFYHVEHQLIYKACCELELEANAQVDLLSVTQRLKEKKELQKIGGGIYLVQLTQKISTALHIEYHCRILMQFYIRRTEIVVGKEMQEKAFQEDKDCFELLDESYQKLDDITEYLQKKQEKSFSQNIDTLIESFNETQISVPSGVDAVNKFSNGYQLSNLVILAARPGMGKTAYALSEARSQAIQGYPVGFLSMEMSDRELTGRVVSNHCEINANKMANRTVNDNEMIEMMKGVEEIRSLPLYINDQPSLTLMEAKVQAKKWKREHDIKILYIDYLQLMQGSNETTTREQQISQISRGLKSIAKELDICVIALSQLSRKVEERGDKRPILSDLRESGAIEQDADVVNFLFRPEYYGMPEFYNTLSSENRAELIWAKYRNGTVGSEIIGCHLHYMRFFTDEQVNDPVSAVDNYI
mgnify:CR=1 FL=1